jgi:hypothetical protein
LLLDWHMTGIPPNLGRFMQPAPIGTDGGFNLYEYGGSDPINKTDPMGTIAVADNLIGAGISVGVDFAAQSYVASMRNQSIWNTYDWKQGSVALGLGFATSGLSSFAEGAIEGTGAVALGARTVGPIPASRAAKEDSRRRLPLSGPWQTARQTDSFISSAPEGCTKVLQVGGVGVLGGQKRKSMTLDGARGRLRGARPCHQGGMSWNLCVID